MARVDLIGPDSHTKAPTTRDENKESGWSFKRIVDGLNDMLTELYASATAAAAAIAPFSVAAASVTVDRVFITKSYTVATLPDAVVAGVIYVSDGAAGSPILAFSDGTDWLRCDTAAAVASS